jgi:glucosamine--fructose-6-phosphate aminotransferase (isomerizing)
MCGIVGYLGKGDAIRVILDGLRRLEYRGYDSAGVAVLQGNKLQICRCCGKVGDLAEKLKKNPIYGSIGIGHTRWATHGTPSEENAHPHTDCRKSLVIVHNGIIENYMSLKKELLKEGHIFRSETDTEVVAHLIGKYMRGDGFEEGVLRALGKVKGSYALCVISKAHPGKIIAARCGSPLVIGIADNERFVASDVPAIIRETRDVIHLDDGEIGVLGEGSDRFISLGGKKLHKPTTRITWNVADAEKGDYPHFMLKEIHEQPRAVEDTMLGRVAPDMTDIHLEEFGMRKRDIKSVRRIVMTACGTSWHAALVGKYLFEEHTRIPVEVDYAAEFRYRDPMVDKNTLVIVISQSGETA